VRRRGRHPEKDGERREGSGLIAENKRTLGGERRRSERESGTSNGVLGKGEA